MAERIVRISSVAPEMAVMFEKAARMTGDRKVEVIAAGPLTIQVGKGRPIEVKEGNVGIRQDIDYTSTIGEHGGAAFRRNLGILNAKVYGSEHVFDLRIAPTVWKARRLVRRGVSEPTPPLRARLKIRG